MEIGEECARYKGWDNGKEDSIILAKASVFGRNVCHRLGEKVGL